MRAGRKDSLLTEEQIGYTGPEESPPWSDGRTGPALVHLLVTLQSVLYQS